MPIRDAEARLRSIQLNYNPSAVADPPVNFDLALFSGDPMVDPLDGGGVEVTGGGYARQTVSPTDWLVDGEAIYTFVSFPDATDEWAAEITHWALLGDDGFWWDCNELAEPVTVTGPGPFDPIRIDIYSGDAVTTTEEP